jgi:hypothetical protein
MQIQDFHKLPKSNHSLRSRQTGEQLRRLRWMFAPDLGQERTLQRNEVGNFKPPLLGNIQPALRLPGAATVVTIGAIANRSASGWW